MNRKSLFLLCAIFLSSCAQKTSKEEILTSIYNLPYEVVSESGETESLGVENCWCGEFVSFDVHQNRKLAEQNVFLMRARVSGTEKIRESANLHFDIDGEQFSFSPAIEVDRFGGEPSYSKRKGATGHYLVPVSFLEKALIGQRVSAKIEHEEANTVTEGVCSPHRSWSERYIRHSGTHGFRKFYFLIKKNKKHVVI